MAKAKEKKDEKMLEEATLQPEEVPEGNASEQATEGAAVPAEAEKNVSAPAKVRSEDDGKEDILVPIGMLTAPDDEHIPVCVSGKIYQVAVGVKVRVPAAVAEVLKNAMAQKTKVDRMIKAKNGKSVEINS